MEQDIRENYIAVKVGAVSDNDQEIRALYALPHGDYPADTQYKLPNAIQSVPEQIRKFSLASLTFPRAQNISSGNEFVEHIDMPVRHLKPEVQEVKWLDIIFSDN